MPLQKPPIVPLIIATALFMENLDASVIATALPAIARSIDANPLHLNLAITSYLLSLAVFIPASGWVADRFGAKPIFRLSILVFMLGSLLCGQSDLLLEFVGARILQGAGGAMMVPVGRLVLFRSVEKHDLVRAMAYLTIPALIGPIMGPPVGGFLTTYVDWRWIFWINIPIGVAGYFLIGRYIPIIPPQPARPFDGPGFLLTAIGFSGLIFGLETVGRDLLPGSATLALLIVGALALVCYVIHASRAKFPIIDLTLLRIKTYRSAIVGGFLFRVGIGATPFLLPMMLQLGFGLNPFHSGMLTFAAAAGAMVMKTTAGPILRRAGFRQVLIVNGFICGAFMAVNGLFTPATPGLLIIAILLSGGFFRSLQFTAINALTMSDVAGPQLGPANSLSAIGQQLSLTVGVAVGAMALHLTLAWRGQASVGPDDFWPAFLAVGAITTLSTLIFIRLPADAGDSVTGHRAGEAARPEP